MKQFCPVCDTMHEPGAPCFNGAEQAMHEMGLVKRARKGPPIQRAQMIKAGLYAVLAMTVLILAGSLVFWLAL